VTEYRTHGDQTAAQKAAATPATASTTDATSVHDIVSPPATAADNPVEALRALQQRTPDCSTAAYLAAADAAGVELVQDEAARAHLLGYLSARMVSPEIAMRAIEGQGRYFGGRGALPEPPLELGHWTEKQRTWATGGSGRSWLVIQWADEFGRLTAWQLRWAKGEEREEDVSPEGSKEPEIETHKFDFPAGRDTEDRDRLVDGLHANDNAEVAVIIESPVRGDALASLLPPDADISIVAVGGITMAYEGKANPNNPSDILPRLSPDVLDAINYVHGRYVLWCPDADHAYNKPSNDASQITVESLLDCGAKWAGVVCVPEELRHPRSGRVIRLDDGAGLDDLARAYSELMPDAQWLGPLLADATEATEYVRRWRQYADDASGYADRLADWAVDSGVHLFVTDPQAKTGDYWHWNARNWQIDGSRRAITGLAREAANTAFGDSKTQTRKLRKLQRSRLSISSAVDLAITDDRLNEDVSLWEPLAIALLFPVREGVLDLATGTLLPHDPARRFVASSNVSWKGLNYRHPLWNAHRKKLFVYRDSDGQWTRAVDLERLAQELLGVALMGRICDVFSLWIGEGGCGIGTTLSACMDVMGSYGGAVKARDLVGDGNQFSLSQLIYKRGAISGEVADRHRIDGANLKSAAQDGEEQDRERKNKDSRNYRNTCSLFIPGNGYPKVDLTDADTNGLRRRARILEFTRVIPDAEKIAAGDIQAALRQPDVQSAILAWMARGAKRVIDNGLEVCHTTASDHHVAMWIDGRDRLSLFLSECVTEGTSTDMVVDRLLYARYLAWADDNAIPAGHRTQRYGFTARLTKKWGTPHRRSDGAKYWYGKKMLTRPSTN